MIRCLVTIAALLLAATAAHADVPDDDRLRFLMQWAADALGVRGNVDLPRIVVVSDRALQVEVYGAEAVASGRVDADNHALAAYDMDAGAMLVSASRDLTDPAQEYILVHELVHHLQFVHGLPARCPAEYERDAYRIHNLWVRATGLGVEKDALSAFVFAQCWELDRR